MAIENRQYVGIVLAAGIGSRLRPMTAEKPKCLIKTAGKPILQYQLDAYVRAGITEVAIVVGHEGEAIVDYCKHMKDLKITILDNPDFESTNNMYSLYLARDFVKDRPFILNNADLSIDSSIVEKLIQHDAADAVAIDSSIFNHESMKVEINEDGFISNIAKTVREDASKGCSIDFYKFSADAGARFMEQVVEIIEVEKNLKDWTEVALQRMFHSQELKFRSCDIAGLNWVEIDNYADLAISDRLFSGLDQAITEIKTVIFDLDGTLYVGSEAVPGAARTVGTLQSEGKRIFFLSNNSSKNKADYVERLSRMGITTDIESIILSTDGVIDYLKGIGVEQVHVLGTNSLKKTFLDEGFQIDSASPEYIVIGYDTELSYKKLITACRHINAGVDIIATHCDMTCPSEHGPVPDVGALLELVRLTTTKGPVKVFGKPAPEMVSSFMRKFDVDPNTTLVVGDRLHTDILMAREIGAKSLLVLTGETQRDWLEDSTTLPDHVLPAVSDLV